MLFDLYGDFAIEGDRAGAIRLPAVVRLAAALGVSGMATRAAAARMVQDGWLRSERRGRESVYALSTRGNNLVRAGRRRIFAQPDAPWDGQWTVVALTVPESDRQVRDRMRQELSFLGFGSPSSAQYISPRDHAAEVLRLAEDAAALEYVQVYRSTAIWPDEPWVLVERAWSRLDAVNRRYAEFLARFGPAFEGGRAATAEGVEREAFITRFTLANQFRKCLFDDPELPRELTPPGWRGGEARRLFLAYHTLVSPPALDFFDRENQGAPTAS